MSYHMKTFASPVLLVGAGRMALEYARVFKDLRQPFCVQGRGAETARRFAALTGIAVSTTGLEEMLAGRGNPPDAAIVAVDVEQSVPVLHGLLAGGVKRILVEKPGGLTTMDICQARDLAETHHATVYVAYNRRYYASTLQAQEIIASDGGVRSFHFEFTELYSRIKTAGHSEMVLKHWFLANTTHLIDLAFHLGGRPDHISCYTTGSTEWHPEGAVFAGAGTTAEGVLFSYKADWEAPGRWSLELMTPKRRLIFCPLEELYEQRSAFGEKRKIDLAGNLDREFKPGLYRQVRAFLYGENAGALPAMAMHYRMAVEVYQNMLNGERTDVRKRSPE